LGLPDLINQGLIVINDDGRHAGEAAGSTIIVTGAARGGTSMIAQILDRLGLFLGDARDHVVVEDTEILRAVLDGNTTRLNELIEDRNRRFPTWGFKVPDLHNFIGPQGAALFRQPRFVVVFRDPLAVAQRSALSTHQGAAEAIRAAVQNIEKLGSFVNDLTVPALLISYEKALQNYDYLVEKLSAFCGLTPSYEQRAAAAAVINPNDPDYIWATQIMFRGTIDDIREDRLRGWCCFQTSDKPVEIEVLSGQRQLAVLLADGHRDDLEAARVHAGRHAFNVDLAPFGLNPDDTITVRPINQSLSLPYSGATVAALRDRSQGRQNSGNSAISGTKWPSKADRPVATARTEGRWREGQTVRIAAACVVKNEADDIAEWIAFHLAIGITTILIYENGSTDRTRNIALAFSEKYDVRVIPWNLISNDYQRRAYMDAVNRLAGQVDWIAFIDADEFIASDDPQNTLHYFDSIPDDVSQVCLNWATFGSSGHDQRPDGLVIEAYSKRSVANAGINRHVKSIVRPAQVRACTNVHVFQVTGRTVDAHSHDIVWSERNGLGLIEGAPLYDKLWINHYWTKSKSHWLKKLARGYHDIPNDRRGLEELNAFDGECRELDQTLSAVADDVRALMHGVLGRQPDQRLRRRIWRNVDPYERIEVDHYRVDLQGWGSSHGYLSSSIDRVRPQLIVEIGAWKGGSSVFMAKHLRHLGLDGVIVSVDTWRGAWDHWLSDQWFRELVPSAGSPDLFRKFLSNVKKLDLQDYVIPLPLDSMNAYVVLKSLAVSPDIIHIDGAHDYTAVMNDLVLWWQILRSGGIMMGDNYDTGGGWPDVRRAFDDFVSTHPTADFEFGGNKCRFRKI
jgi:glycosyltransferase involved in cell wall biosynthesis/predicted O-methyltransferase YrrM